MNPDDLARILDELGERLGPTGEYVFALAVRYKFTDSLVGFVFGVGLVLVVAVVYALVWRHSFDRSYDRDFALQMGGLIAACACGIGLLIVAMSLPNLLNPEYAAIRDILAAIGGVR